MLRIASMAQSAHSYVGLLIYTNILRLDLSFAFYMAIHYNIIPGNVEKAEDLINLLSEVRDVVYRHHWKTMIT